MRALFNSWKTVGTSPSLIPRTATYLPVRVSGDSVAGCGTALPAVTRGIDPMRFSWSGPTRFFRSWVRICIGPSHFLRWIVYYCVCIQHDSDKSQLSFIELCKTLRTNSGLMAINSCLHLFSPQLCRLTECFSKDRCVTAEFKIFISRADCGVWTHPHFYTDYAPGCHCSCCNSCISSNPPPTPFANVVRKSRIGLSPLRLQLCVGLLCHL